jgi:hypothetical protein
MEKQIVINILPQDPTCWAFIGVAAIFTSLAIFGGDGSNELSIERERTNRIEKLMKAGYTNAVISEIERDLKFVSPR